MLIIVTISSLFGYRCINFYLYNRTRSLVNSLPYFLGYVFIHLFELKVDHSRVFASEKNLSFIHDLK